MYKVKEVARRGSALVAAVSLFAGIGASALPGLASADSLNPLTERSLTLSSSSPGWAFTDGSGNSTYAGPNTGTNGKKTGNTFSFRTSSDATVNAFTFQYCSHPAGECEAPGDDGFSGTSPTMTRNSDPVGGTTSDFNVAINQHVSSGSDNNSEVSSSDYSTKISAGAGADFGNVSQVPDGQDVKSPYVTQTSGGPVGTANGVAGNFVVLTGNSATGHVDTYSGGWNMSASNQEENANGNVADVLHGLSTGKNNMITLSVDGTTNTGVHLHPGDYVKIIFFGTDDNYITNPGKDAFYVKINDYNTTTPSSANPITTESDIVDGGVTVANVMNQSIQIQTKVLETMDFSVGTVDPNTLDSSDGDGSTLSTFEKAEGVTTPDNNATLHGQCDPVLTRLDASSGATANVLSMGNSIAENSLETSKTYATHSYWRLSSNSSGGATVYYAGNTLSNTEGDRIAPAGVTAVAPRTGSEQFGLALDNGTSTTTDAGGATGKYPVSYPWATDDPINNIAYEQGADTSVRAKEDTTTGSAGDWLGTDPSFKADITTQGLSAHQPRLYPLTPDTNYGGGSGGINLLKDSGNVTVESVGTTFAYDTKSQTVPTAIASESSQVVDCVTGKMRYIGNIAATTPAGIYTTKINYIASPQY